MSAALTLLLIGSLLQGALCGEFKASMPQTIEVLRGSCVTIPCSFDVVDQYKSHLDNTCRAIWMIDQRTVFNSSNPQTSTNNRELRGDLTKKDCTTTLNNMQPDNGNNYFFRLECDNGLRYIFNDQISISVTDDPPRPTLTPSALKVKEGTSVRLTCSAPAPCLSHPPTVTWTPDLGESVETLQENQDKTKVKTSVVTFTASQNHHGKTISCMASYNKQDGSTESAVTSLTAHISYSPKDTSVSVRPSGPVPEGRTVTLTCSSTANPAVKSYTWYRADGGQETFIGTGAVLNIKAFKDDSPFFCKAENNIGAGRSTNKQIDVQYSPKDTSVSVRPSGPVPEGRTVTLTCSSTANPAVKSYTWYRADGGQETFIGTGAVINIKASHVNSYFFCKTLNKIGAGRSTNKQIDVQYSPKDTSVSVRPSGPVPEGRTVTLTCSSTANPAVKSYTWYRADGAQETFIGTGAVLNIKASKDDSYFFCKADNNIGDGRSGIIHIDVQGALCGEFKASMPQTIEVLRGSCVTIPCSFEIEDQYKSHLDNTYDPPRPTLTPSALKVKEGTSVRLTCSAPAPCLSHPPTVTWTPVLGESVETLQENQDKTKVKTSVVTFTASQNHHGETISCALCEEFKVSMPQTIEVLRGSCMTIPCSFEIDDRYESNLDNTYDPPRPTLTPSALKVKEGTSVRLTCSAPAPCLSHPPTVTWTPDLGESVETLQENQNKTKVKTSVVQINIVDRTVEFFSWLLLVYLSV
ncbi:B-cell receptor CD22-like [Anarhichas minor]|uniref:B-cell receptor CD22-like n=1 Tax=Anarhichas minor TaxID=65739 RepID=UPI003F7345CA